jgi:hypothetical protein
VCNFRRYLDRSLIEVCQTYGQIGVLSVISKFVKVPEMSVSSAFKLACLNGSSDVMRKLWNEHREQCLQCDIKKLFICACESGNYETALTFLSFEDVQLDYNEGFVRSCRNGHLNIVSLFIDQESAVDVNCSHGLPLVTSSRHGHIEIVQLLLDSGAKISNDALDHAVSQGHMAVVDLLEKHRRGDRPHVCVGVRDNSMSIDKVPVCV